MPGLDDRQTQLGGDAGRHDVVQVEGGYFPPHALYPQSRIDLIAAGRLVALHEDGPVIAAPGVVGRVVMEEDPAPVGAGGSRERGGLGLHGRVRPR